MFRPSLSLIRSVRPAILSRPPPVSTSRSIERHNPRRLIVRQGGRHASSSGNVKDPLPPKPQIDYEAEHKLGQQKLKSDPSKVSTESSTRKRYESVASPIKDDESVNSGLKHDFGIIRDTFRLSNIPKQSHYLGLAGTVPYLATSLSTLYLGWDMTKGIPTGNSFYDSIIINHDTAQYLLSVLEPVQLGYGAVIISFLGAIHWGLEYAEKTSERERTRFRYGIGVAASIVAWPTVLMSIEYGLITQFMAFVALYFADARASARGWAPSWYGQYRFMLTAMVGLAIFISLVGRSEIDKSERLSKQHLRNSMNRPGIADTTTDWAKIEAEEKKEKELQDKKTRSKQKNVEGKLNKVEKKDDEANDKDENDDTKSESSNNSQGNEGENKEKEASQQRDESGEGEAHKE